MQPPLGREHLGRLVGIVEVAQHDAPAAQEDLAGLAWRDLAPTLADDAHLEPGTRTPHRGGHRLRVVVVRGATRGPALGQSVAGDHPGEGQLGIDPPDQLDRDVGRTGDGDAQGREVVVVAGGVVEDGLVERGRTGQHRDPLGRDPGEDPVHVEHRLGEHRRPRRHTGQDARLEPEHVEVRVHLEIDVAGRKAGHGHPVSGDGERAPVRHDDALGHPRGARREEDVRRVVGGERGAPARHLVEALRRRPTHEVVPRQRALGNGTPHDDGGGQVGSGVPALAKRAT